MQPTLRGRAPGGADAYAFDVLLTPAPLALDPGAATPGNRRVRITAGSFEAAWAANLAANMPKRGQTVVKVAGAFAVGNALKAVALARPALRRTRGQDLVFVPVWDPSGWTAREFGGGRGGNGGGGGGSARASSSGGDAGAGDAGASGRAQRAPPRRAGAGGGAGGAGPRSKLLLAVMGCREGDPLNVLPWLSTGGATPPKRGGGRSGGGAG